MAKKKPADPSPSPKKSLRRPPPKAGKPKKTLTKPVELDTERLLTKKMPPKLTKLDPEKQLTVVALHRLMKRNNMAEFLLAYPVGILFTDGTLETIAGDISRALPDGYDFDMAYSEFEFYLPGTTTKRFQLKCKCKITKTDPEAEPATAPATDPANAFIADMIANPVYPPKAEDDASYTIPAAELVEPPAVLPFAIEPLPFSVSPKRITGQIVTTDGDKYEFEAQSWFINAAAAEIVGLFKRDWADMECLRRIVSHCADDKTLWTQLQKSDIKISLNADEVLAFLQRYRPTIAEMILPPEPTTVA
jgi:hypothetical protein